MISRINTTSLLFLILVLGLGFSNNESKLTVISKAIFQSSATIDHESAKKDDDKNIVGYIFEYERSEEALDQDKSSYQVRGTDENGNEVYGSVNIEGKLGIGIIRGVETKRIEVVAERTSRNLLLATDITGYEYKLRVYRN
jgi:hypothetical protein